MQAYPSESYYLLIFLEVNRGRVSGKKKNFWKVENMLLFYASPTCNPCWWYWTLPNFCFLYWNIKLHNFHSKQSKVEVVCKWFNPTFSSFTFSSLTRGSSQWVYQPLALYPRRRPAEERADGDPGSDTRAQWISQ